MKLTVLLPILLFSLSVIAAPTLFKEGSINLQAVSIGDSAAADSKSLLDIKSTTKGVLFPRMTTTQMNAIASPTTGLMIWNTTAGTLYQYTGSTWLSLDTLPSQSGNSGKYLTTNGTTTSWATVDAFPSQAGNSGKYLTTNGTTTSWGTVDALPTQTGNSGKFLTTNGTTASWADAGLSTQGQTEGSAVTTTTLKAPNNQLTTTGTNERLIETGNGNLLANPSFEHSTAETSWTVAAFVIKDAETTEVRHGKKSIKITPANVTGAMLYQDITPTIKMSGMSLEYTVSVKTSLSTVTFCARQGGSTVGSCTAVIGDGNWRTYTINYPGPSSGSVGMAIVGASSTGDIYVDDAYIGQARNIGTAIVKQPTVQKFTSGSGTYTTAAGASYIRIKMVGGGGGGAGGGTNASTPTSTAGGSTTFGSSLLTANGGAASSASPGSGGTCALNLPAIGTAMAGGSGTVGADAVAYAIGGASAPTPFGGAASGGTNAAPGGNAQPNTGSGGGGGGGSTAGTGRGGAGGAAGCFIDAIIQNPSSSYSYSIGSGGNGGSAGTGGTAGGAGGSGYIEVTEYYGPQTVVSTQQAEFAETDCASALGTNVTSNFTNTTITCKVYRRKNRAYFDIVGTGTGAAGTVSALDLTLPVTIDTAKISGLSPNTRLVGYGQAEDSGVAAYGPYTASVVSSTAVRVRYTNGTSTQTDVSNTVPFTFSTSDVFNLKFDVPVLGWIENPIPLIPQSVISDSAGVEKICRATIANSGTASFTTQSGCFTNISRDSGSKIITLTMSGFSGAASCNCTPNGNPTIRKCGFSAPTTSTTVTPQISDNSGTGQDQGFEITCVGPR